MTLTPDEQEVWIGKFIEQARFMVGSRQYRGTVLEYLSFMRCHDPETKAATIAEYERQQRESE